MIGAEGKGLLLVCRSFVGSSVTLSAQLRDGIEQRFISGKAEPQREREKERSARNATGILRGGFAGGEREGGKSEKANVPYKRETGGAAETSSTTTMTLRAKKGRERETDVFRTSAEHDLVERRWQFTGNGGGDGGRDK